MAKPKFSLSVKKLVPLHPIKGLFSSERYQKKSTNSSWSLAGLMKLRRAWAPQDVGPKSFAKILTSVFRRETGWYELHWEGFLSFFKIREMVTSRIVGEENLRKVILWIQWGAKRQEYLTYYYYLFYFFWRTFMESHLALCHISYL